MPYKWKGSTLLRGAAADAGGGSGPGARSSDGTLFALPIRHMALATRTMRYGQRRITRKLIRSFPLLGAVVAVATVVAVARRKGLARGVVDAALDFTPIVGFVKNALEVARGRDFIPDRPVARRVQGPRP